MRFFGIGNVGGFEKTAKGLAYCAAVVFFVCSVWDIKERNDYENTKLQILNNIHETSCRGFHITQGHQGPYRFCSFCKEIFRGVGPEDRFEFREAP